MTPHQKQKQIPIVLQLPAEAEVSLERQIDELRTLAGSLRSMLETVERLGVKLVYSEEEAAKELGISVRLLQSKRLAGDVPFKYVGRKPVYTRSHLEQFLSK